jgi:hypothetical protein
MAVSSVAISSVAISSVASVLAALLALFLLLVYFVKKQQERGQDPRYTKEVYLYLGEGGISAAAKRLGASLASAEQVRLYASEGGMIAGCGFAVGQGSLVTIGKTIGKAADGGASRCGVWLYGPKPRRGTPCVLPFAKGMWFQQEATESG